MGMYPFKRTIKEKNLLLQNKGKLQQEVFYVYAFDFLLAAPADENPWTVWDDHIKPKLQRIFDREN